MTTTLSLTVAHRGVDELPFVDIGDGCLLRVLQLRAEEGLWVIENVFQAGFCAPAHRHTGPVHGFTQSGAWKYRESPEVNRAGSFLYEPAGSQHTLECLEDNTRVWFHMVGANLNIDDSGQVLWVDDGPSVHAFYVEMCEQQGLPVPNVVLG